ncbi:hypothetical protein COCON_G00019740 [Conger conger]|uniref:Uncharacterized protein n=1 Tax=Conger conger TaxID=82655 RepID=A0A9Q1E445_CONCO|nr:hypothetical protein COCON_G00019740 [Conger conger]
MLLDTAALWAVLQWSGCVLVAASLLPIVLLVCVHCGQRKTTPPPGDLELELQTEAPFASVAAELQNTSRSPRPQSQNPTEVQQTGSEGLGDEGRRQLPRIPLQEGKQVRRHSSYTGSSVYDTVQELRCHWPEPDSRETSTCSQLYKEEPFPVYAQIHKNTAGSRDRNTDLHLYASVKKSTIRSVKSQLFP